MDSFLPNADRPFPEKLADIEDHPENWEIESVHTERATRKRARRRGASVQIIYKHQRTGETIVRHKLIDDAGHVVEDHYRPDYRPRAGEI